MKLTKAALGLATVSALLFLGCSNATATYSEEQLGLRNTNLYTEKGTTGDNLKEGVK